MRSRHNRRGEARLVSKLAQIRAALIESGCDTIAKQAKAFALGRSTTWAMFNKGTRRGPSAKVVKRILSSSALPLRARREVEEYIKEKSRGVRRARAFRDVFQAGRC